MAKHPAAHSYLAALALCVGAMPLAVLLHLVWGADRLIIALLGATCVGLPLYVYATWHKRHEHTRTTAALFTAGLTTWVTAATAGKPWGHVTLDLWGFGSLVMPTMWGMRHTGLSGGTEHDKARKGVDSFLERLRNVLVGLREHKVITEDGGRVVAEYSYPAGEMTPGDVQNALPNIASALELPQSAVTVAPVKGRGNRVRITAQPHDPLAGDPIAWPGFSMPGASVNDAPLRFGMRADGKEEGLWVCGDPAKGRQLVHTLNVGMPASGKSDTGIAIMLDGLSRRDFVPIAGSSIKFAQTYGSIGEALAVGADGPEQMFQLISNFPAVLKYRSALFAGLERSDGEFGYSEWVPELWEKYQIPLVFVILDEAASVVSKNEDFNEGVRALRSLGVHLFVEIQSAVGTSIDRNIRDMIGQRLAHGCMSSIDTGFALSDTTIAAGADPTKWGANKAGAHYAELTGVPADQWHLEGRTFRTDVPGLRRKVLADTASTRARLDPGTAKAFGTGMARPDSCKPRDPGRNLPSVIDAVTDGLLREGVDRDTVAYLADRPADDLPDLDAEYADVDTSQPIPNNLPAGVTVPVTSARRPGDAVTTEQAREMFDLRFEQLAARQREITAADFSDVRQAAGRSRTWPIGELKRLERAGLVRQAEPGSTRYEIRQRAA